MNAAGDVKVVVRNAQGQFLTGDGRHWTFTDDRSQAVTFDYYQDKVAEQLDWAEHSLLATWSAIRATTQSSHETCDWCGTPILAKTFFKGTDCLCEDCANDVLVLDQMAA